jgi:hypothetical protein
MHILFLIHGMGRQMDGWAEPVTDLLQEKANQYKYFRDGTTLQDQVVFEPIRYDNVFDDLLDRWHDNFSGIMSSEAGPLIPEGKLIDLMDSMDKEEREFFWSHVADVLIYRFFPLYRDRIRIEVIRAIAQKIQHYRDQFGNNTRFSFLAHSLGTAVIHDSLHLLGATEWDDEIANVMGPPHTRFQSLFMLANTSRILQSDIDVTDSIVCPVGGHGDQNREYLDQYVNVFHKYDPITLMWQVNGKSLGSNFQQINLSHFRDVNIHDFNHYLDHPAVHIPLFRTLCGFRSVVPAEQLLAMEAYKDIDRQSVITELQNRIEGAKSNIDEDSTLMDLIKIWVKLKKMVGGDLNIPI